HGLLPHRSDRHHKLPSSSARSSGRRMRNQVHRFGAIKPPIRKIVASKAAALTMLASLVALGAAFADAVGDFYKGRAVDLYIGYSVGGAYDLYARGIGRPLGGHNSWQPTA